MENYKIKVQDTVTGESGYIKTSEGDYITQRNSGLKILTDLDLKGSYVDNVTLIPVSVPPSNPKEGQIYYNEKKKKSYQYNGTEWKEIGGSDVGKVTAEGGEIFNHYTANIATGSFSHSEGTNNAAKGEGSHAEGYGNVIDVAAMAGHAEGWGNGVSGTGAHAEGSSNIAQGDYSHAEGEGCIVDAYCGHVEGMSTMSVGESSHAEGVATTSWGVCSHAEGDSSETGGGNGYKVTGQGEDNYHLVLSTVEGIAVGEIMLYTLGSSGGITSKKIKITAIDTENKIITVDTEVELSANVSYIIFMTKLNNQGGEILPTSAQHSEGDGALAVGHVTHAEGRNTKAFGAYSHAEGNATITYGNMSHAEGNNTKAEGHLSHAEGIRSVSSGTASHAEGQQTSAMGQASHAEGVFTVANGRGQHVQGVYNIEDTEETYLHIVGNGEGASARSNAHTIDHNGNGWFKGNLKIGGTSYEDETAKELATKEDLNNKVDRNAGNIMIGSGARARGGVAIGVGAQTNGEGGGYAIGDNASAENSGVAIGDTAISLANVAIGNHATGNSGIAIGNSATALSETDTIQIGKGKNTNDYTMQIYDYQVVANDAETKSATDGSKYLKDVGKLTNLQTTDKTNIVSAVNEVKNGLVGKKGTGVNSLIFNDTNNISSGNFSVAMGGGNKAISSYSSAYGYNTIAGSNVFKIVEFDDTNKIYTLDSIEGLAVDDVFSLLLSNGVYMDYGKITVIDVTNSKITVDTYKTNPDTTSTHYLRINKKPQIGTTGYGNCSSSEGVGTKALGSSSHAEGNNTQALGSYSHAEGYNTQANNYGAHAEGQGTKVSGYCGHAEGTETEVRGSYSHTEGYKTIAMGSAQHVEGTYNIIDEANEYAHIIGNGLQGTRSNAHTVDKKGNAWYSGDIKIGGTNYKDTAAKTVATTDYVPAKAKNATTADKLTNKVTINMSGAISGQSVQFDGSSGITLEATQLKDNYLRWDTNATPSVNGLTPLDQALAGQSGNCFGFLLSECMKVEYSTDNGENWIDYPFTDEDKTRFLTPETRSSWVNEASYIYLGGPIDVPVTTNSLTRITIDAWAGEDRALYANIKKLIMRISTNGAKNCKIKLQKECCNNLGTYVDMGECLVAGWPKWLTLNSNFIFGANSVASGGEQAKSIRLIMSCGALSETSKNKFVLQAVQAISDNIYWYNGDVTPSCYIQNHVPYQLKPDRSVSFIGDIKFQYSSNKLIGVSQKAEQDINGKAIVDTYATKTEVNSQISAMSNLKACYHINIGNITSEWKTAITLDNFNKDNTVVYALNESGTNADGGCTIQKILSVGNSVDMGLFVADGSTTVLMQLTEQGLIQLKIGESGAVSGSESSKIHVMVYTGVSNTTITSLS